VSKKTIVVAHIHEYELSDVLDNVQEGDGNINAETQAEMSEFISVHFAEGTAQVREPIYYICDEDSPVIDTSVYTFDVDEAIKMAGWVE
jgi:hypothetical protein